MPDGRWRGDTENAMRHLLRRLRKLEERALIVDPRSWNERLTELRHIALSKVSAADRDLFQSALARTLKVPIQPEIWERLDTAFEVATAEANFPIVFKAMQWLW